MHFEKIKRQKQQKQIRQNLKTHIDLINLQDIWQPLKKSYLQTEIYQVLRVITCIEVNYLIYCYIEIMKKMVQEQMNMSQSINNSGIDNLKIGIIGGGVTGRLILNNLLIFTKEGLDPRNITISTREIQKFNQNIQNFQINVCFNNEETAQQSDILFICTPATLDNWIITDLKQSLLKRINNKTKFLKPLVYITTSNVYKEKCDRLFGFPTLIPIIRGSDIDIINQIISALKILSNQEKEKDLLKQKKIEKIESILSKIISQEKQYHNFLEIMDFITGNKSTELKSISPSKQISKDKESQTKIQQPKRIGQIIIEGQQNIQNTFLIRCRKWRMAYNNYMA